VILLSVWSGIVTNYKDVKMFLLKKGYQFESETDTEVIAKLVHLIYSQNPNCSFRELIEQVIQQLVRVGGCTCTLSQSPAQKSQYHYPLIFPPGCVF
jgi:glucosamine 6-phosphate synthetase-like amidotransferase/phosphosugar isomerase protein